MAMYVYSTGGDPVGFLYESYIYDLTGTPLGRILGSRVYRLDGSYAGEWYKEMVVDRPSGFPRDIAPVRIPPRRQSPGFPGRRRAVIDYGFPDRFDRLYEGGAFRQAAE
jgi:hypothetical protein